jgi:hypothetical protein
MVRNNYICLNNKGLFLIFVLIGVNLQAYAEESLGATIDCSNIVINYVDRPDMTRSERIEAMNKAFYESVNRFELCNLSNQSIPTSESASGDQQGSDGSEDGNENAMDGTESSTASFDSVESPLMSGTETESTSTSQLPDSPESSDKQENAKDESIAVYGSAGGSGATPEDIPDANNDDAVAAQIRLAAELEKDPVKKEKLWNEYRKYTGLPVKDNEQ